MADRGTTRVLTDAQWKRLSALIEAVHLRGKTEHHDLRRTIAAIIWRHRNGAPWRAIPAELGPCWTAAQTFNRWGHLWVWERLLELAQRRGIALGMALSDGTTIRAHQKTADGARKGGRKRSGMRARRLAARAAASGPRLA
ncbi:transposase [Siccirubricoccus deserti]|nr:transposase [Siccirubricoccus deserti]